MTDLENPVEKWTEVGIAMGWMVTHKGVTVLTEKYFTTKGQKPPAKAPGDWKEKYLAFIKEVFGEKRVRLPYGTSGSEFTVSDFSKPGMEAFAKCMKEPSMDYSRLVQASRAFYLDPRNSRPTIGNYFIKELWVSVYRDYNPASVQTQTFNIEL
ncbi:hypothetical protein Q5H92_15010 [Hymenobacter sp. M29]|uniref:Uncharacterized protein n=1 Tax=Hymenobacter mellowenesis TaxID=3063995 RepID=A0ABT9ACU3_9BACT|nr:hypothetical protein [Hymenobacter sp. M29]MDO7847677.1 hypothetical protein [Hymenobacter sp. M29]